MCLSIPKYVRERLHEFPQLEQPWKTQVDSTLNAYLTNFKQLVQQLNVFSAYAFDQLQQVTDFAARGMWGSCPPVPKVCPGS
ncbi:hypothetical protein DSO57_1019021 [Entomophthora muscae]|uniref:Uncharacterized protein n=1 Tax=Entomophthora muscae TaxID=34485 RepID=A0ACC2TRQ2_9FUNG|nr:hypothetical protein DSO57_1019021 [Entomophthora muscae]